MLFNCFAVVTPLFSLLFIVADNSEDGEVEEEETKPTVKHRPLRKADSDDQLRQQFEEGKMTVIHRNRCDPGVFCCCCCFMFWNNFEN